MLRHAFYWRAAEAASAEDPLSRYVDAWGRSGDTALIAIADFQPVGAAWYRLFQREHPGFGFVDEETPELAIAVVPSRRRHGIGTELLTALMEQARDEGFRALSLSVERDSPSVALYERHGFVTVGESGKAWTMRADLGSSLQER